MILLSYSTQLEKTNVQIQKSEWYIKKESVHNRIRQLLKINKEKNTIKYNKFTITETIWTVRTPQNH